MEAEQLIFAIIALVFFIYMFYSMIKNNEATDNKVDNSEVQNVIGQNSIETEIINDNISKSDIWLLSVSSIFLLLTIIFSIIYVKHQQKSKKKVSK